MRQICNSELYKTNKHSNRNEKLRIEIFNDNLVHQLLNSKIFRFRKKCILDFKLIHSNKNQDNV